MESLAFAAEIQSLATPAEVSQRLSQVTAPLGFPTHVISPVPSEEVPVEAGWFLVQNWPAEWSATYEAEGFAAFDPVPVAAGLLSAPITITELREGGAGFTPDPRAERLWALAERLGRGCGLLVPVFGPRGYRAIVCFAGPGPDPDPETRALLHLTGLYAHDRIRQLSMARQVVAAQVSGREVEVLDAISDGLNDEETARRLGISVRTVRFHLANARDKLDAASREQAVAKAVAMGLI